MLLTLNSRIKEIYANPIGHDALYRILLQLGKSEKWLTNPLVGNLRLKTLARLAGRRVDADFFQMFLQLLNSEKAQPMLDRSPVQPAWWKEAVFYQIYPRSFKDSNGDGIGDLGGIIEKLDYLKALGVDALWLSPVYDSPNDDNGYDIRDYYAIMREFGTMADFERLQAEIHKRGMRLIMDLVVNHTSDEHAWFQEALKNPDSPYRDYYFFRKTTDGKAPNNWLSFFSGSAWNAYGKEAGEDLWALHLYSKKQMDLNWDNEALRAEIYKMVNWWLDKGVDGFRLDVINYISKQPGLPDGSETIYKLLGFRGIEHFFYGPNLHRYLGELNEKAFAPHQAFSVGETPGVGLKMSQLLTASERKELDMVFSFDHMETPSHTRFEDYRYDLNFLKTYLIDWMEQTPNNCWMSLFVDNHDNPRMLSKVNPDPQFREALAKLLAVIQLTLKGTPFIYQGQEIGMVNQHFTDIKQLRDVESLNLYAELCEKMAAQAAFAKVLAGSRDHVRVPMQWNSEKFAGFSSVEPWLPGDEDYLTCNVENEQIAPGSVLNFYKALIGLRKANQALIYGEVEFVNVKQKNVFAYFRKYQDETFYIECNLTAQAQKRPTKLDGCKLLLSNVVEPRERLQAYEANIYQMN